MSSDIATIVLRVWSADQQHQLHLGTCWECQFSGNHHRPTKSETLGMGPSNLCFYKLSRWFPCVLKLENCCITVLRMVWLIWERHFQTDPIFLSDQWRSKVHVLLVKKIDFYKRNVLPLQRERHQFRFLLFSYCSFNGQRLTFQRLA